jgi:DNA-binding response OmpR family regulator
MPELTGLDLIRELVIRTTAASDRPQILLMAAHATIERHRGDEAQALDHLRKPFEIDEPWWS